MLGSLALLGPALHSAPRSEACLRAGLVWEAHAGMGWKGTSFRSDLKGWRGPPISAPESGYSCVILADLLDILELRSSAVKWKKKSTLLPLQLCFEDQIRWNTLKNRKSLSLAWGLCACHSPYRESSLTFPCNWVTPNGPKTWLAQHQPRWPTPASLSQGLCTCHALCMEHSSLRYLQGWLPSGHCSNIT